MSDYVCGMCEYEVVGRCYAMPPLVVSGAYGTHHTRPQVAVDDHACTKYMLSSIKAAEKKSRQAAAQRNQELERRRAAGLCEGCGGSTIPGDRLCPSCADAEESEMACPGCGHQSDGDMCPGCQELAEDE